jgi:hypothetical protein
LQRIDDERRRLVLEDIEGTWRLTGTWDRRAERAALAAGP